MNGDARPHGLIIFTAPSGSGKTTIARRVLAEVPGARFSVSATTRPPRPGERDGVDYHFVSEARFREMIEEGLLLEYEEVYPGRFYGTPRHEVEGASPQQPVLLDVDVKGALAVKTAFGEAALAVFVRPPSIEALETRLRARGTETPETLATRLARASLELSYAPRFDAVVVNEQLETAVAETLRLVRAFLNG